MSKRDEQKEATYADILRIGEQLFVTNGFEATSVQQIADACRMTKGALYHHFASKEALLAQICRNHYDQLLAAAEPCVARKEIHWFERIGLILAAVRAANAARQPMAGEYLRVRRNAGDGQLGAVLTSYDKKFYRQVIAPILSEARELGEARFSGSPATLAVFVYSLDRAMTEEIADVLERAQGLPGDAVPRLLEDILETFVQSLAALIGIDAPMVRQLVKVPETIAFITGLLQKNEANTSATGMTSE